MAATGVAGCKADIDRIGRIRIGRRVRPVSTIQPVGSAAAEKRIIAEAAGQGLGAGIAAQPVVKGRPGEVLDRIESVARRVAA